MIMSLKTILDSKNISQYRLSKMCQIPYTTINDIYNERTKLMNCSAETVYKIARALDLSVDYLLDDSLRCSFELFKSNVCHQLKELTDINFVIEVLESNQIRVYYERNWFPECFYLLATLDYVSRINNIPLCKEYNDIRQHKLEDVIYPSSIIAMYLLKQDESIKQEAYENSIPEYRKYNIVESEIRNVA